MRIVIAEAFFLLREGLVRLLAEGGIRVVAAVDNRRDLLDALERHRPDVAIVDLWLPPPSPRDGIRAVQEARRRFPHIGVLILSERVEWPFAREVLADGAGRIGLLLKHRIGDMDPLLAAIKQVATDGTVLDPEVASRLAARRPVDHPLGALTRREREVLALIAEGRSNGAIAAMLSVTKRAVNKHINGIFMKLGLPVSDDVHRRVRAVLTYLDGVEYDQCFT